jgi:hypothetical protein
MQEGLASFYKNNILINRHSDFLNIPLNSALIFKNDLSVFTVKKVSKYFIEKEFKKIENNRKIHVFNDCSDLSINDDVDLRYKEYEFDSYTQIISQNGEMFENLEFMPEKGTFSWGDQTILKTRLDENNNIYLEIISKGSYTVPPDNECYFAANNGTRILIDHFYAKKNEMKIQSNVVKNISNYKDYCVVELVKEIQEHISEGILFGQKTIVNTYENLNNINKKNEIFICMTNYLPNLKLHFTSFEDDFLDVFYKNLLIKLDLKFGELDKRLNKLENLDRQDHSVIH